MRTTLVAALIACADTSLKPKARRFLLGLSSDELQFIAEFIGACILESSGQCDGSRSQLAARIAEFQRANAPRTAHSGDRDHKSILLLEFLCRSGLRQYAVPLGARVN